MSKKRSQFLHVVATEEANVREVEPNGSILTDIRFIGKSFDSFLNDWTVSQNGVVLPYTARLVNELKLGTLLPGTAETAQLAGVKYKGQ